MERKDVYKRNGFKDRNDYLSSLADGYGAGMYVVRSLSEMLGEEEDFDAFDKCLG